MLKIELSKASDRALRRMQMDAAFKIRDKLLLLASDPSALSRHVKQIAGRKNGYRLRVNNWRVIYSLEENALVVRTITMAPKGDAYQ